MSVRNAAVVFVCFAASLLLGAMPLSAQQHAFDGTWEMDAAKSHVTDSRVVTITIASVGTGIKVTIKTKRKDGTEDSVEFTNLLDGRPCSFTEGSHQSQLTMWYNGDTLNASKQNGPPNDVSSMWKFELTPGPQTLTETINHYEPAADDETLVFRKKST